MFIALFIKALNQAQCRCLQTCEQRYKMWYILAVEYYSAIKKEQLLGHAITRLNLNNIMLREGSQVQKTELFNSIHVKL